MATTRSRTGARRRSRSTGASPKPPTVLGGAAIKLGPKPFRAKHQLDITVTGLPPRAVASIEISPEGTASGAKSHQADSTGTFQTAIYPVAGPHSVVVTVGGKSVKRDFEVAG